jgi:2-polyprenyl-3-methyl-5-hydroxy-6-metoxy-1,4-benzoquinol methylase
MNEIVLSPITKKDARLLFDIDATFLTQEYKKEVNIDITQLLKGNKSIRLYECEDTGFRFFYPSDIDGDGRFYEQLEQISWYYAEWKWDYEIAKNFIQPNTSVLDIGCGEAKFLDYLKRKKNCECTGLELNEKAKEIACKKGLNVLNQFVQDHAVENSNKYDIVTFFQVLEHIAEIDSFLKAAVACAKPGGKIILAVPNNEPYFLTYDKMHFLNLPPHHMGWWNRKSLTELEKYYGLKLERIETQPLEHFTAYTKCYLANTMPSSSFMQKALYPFFKVLFYLRRNKINGASIMAIYTKK